MIENEIINDRIAADLILIHAPAYFDFRNNGNIYFPYMSTSGAVPITPLYEYFPIGFKTLKNYLSANDFKVEIINLCTLLIKYPEIDINKFIQRFQTKIVGISLHWMMHVQGSLEIASLVKSIYPEIKIIFGGISSNYYAEELITYSFIDMVMRGYDTHEPMRQLLTELKNNKVEFQNVSNLLWKDGLKKIHDNDISHTPISYSGKINWADIPDQGDPSKPQINELLTTTTIGCNHNCTWCGGSSDAFKRIFKCKHSAVLKNEIDINEEFITMNHVKNIDKFHLYLCSSYVENESRFKNIIEQIGGIKMKSVSYEQFYLTKESIIKEMVKANKRTVLTLSPESHDLTISKLAGRGTYSMEEMEIWIQKAIEIGIYEIDIWFFIGMPEQTEKSVYETLDYCHRLLSKFKGMQVVPILCPMIPFLDPGSIFFENPEKHGYRIFFKTLEEHRIGSMRASLINRTNYETKWLSREELIYVSYSAVRKFFQIKEDIGFLPSGVARPVIDSLDDAIRFMPIVHEIDCIPDVKDRKRKLSEISGEIKKRNNAIFFGGVSNQTFPINRNIGGRWIDEIPLVSIHEDGSLW